jgi:hypothetical protein
MLEFIKRPERAREVLKPLLKAFVVLGNMPEYQVKQMLEGLAQEWGSISSGDTPLLTKEDPDGEEEERGADDADPEQGEGVREGDG